MKWDGCRFKIDIKYYFLIRYRSELSFIHAGHVLNNNLDVIHSKYFHIITL